MKKYSVAVCVVRYCFLLVFMAEVWRRSICQSTSGQMRIWQFCRTLSGKMNVRPEWHFSGIYLCRCRGSRDILNIPDREKWQLRILFYRMEQWLMQEDMKFMPLSGG